MEQVAIITADQFGTQVVGERAPETSQRASSIVSSVRTSIGDLVRFHIGRNATLPDLLRVHGKDYLRKFSVSYGGGARHFGSPETALTSNSYDLACLAAGSTCQGVDFVMNGKAEAAFCVVRPPGHHAKVNGTSGFCLLNNVAIGARYAQSIYGIHKILIFDFDGHHGDGTQSIFYEDATVFYVSVHQQDIFPYTGSRSECGKGAGHGFTRNYPLPSGAGDDALMHIVDGDIAQIITTFRPELTFLSSGFDGHIEDPLTGLQFTTEVFAEIADHIRVSLEKAECTKIVSVLEGGYSPRSLSSSAVMHVSGLLGRPYPKIDRLANRSRERE